jgi:hypothetical protein
LRLAVVEAFERKRQARLPDAYRQFLLRLGNGGVGPYTFCPLKDWLEHEGIPEKEVPPDYLSTPSIITPEMLDPKICTPSYEQGPLFRKFINEQRIEQEENYLGCGMVTLSSCGCAFYVTLVVSGPYADRILYFGGYPYFSDEPDFLSWYERWLDERAAGHDLHYFGWGPAGDEATLLRSAAGLRKEVFLRAITRFRRLSQSGLKMVCNYLTDHDPLIRDLSSYSLRNLNVPPAKEYVETLRKMTKAKASRDDFASRIHAKRILERWFPEPPSRLADKLERWLTRNRSGTRTTAQNAELTSGRTGQRSNRKEPNDRGRTLRASSARSLRQ